MVKHEKNAKHKCDECHRSYGTNAKLQSHKKLVHEQVKCNECGKKSAIRLFLKDTKQLYMESNLKMIFNVNFVQCFLVTVQH